MAGGSAPKKERVREHLLSLVRGRAVGEAIPSERVLSAQLGVSRPTLRAAADELVACGLLRREHGRGMFVAVPAHTVRELLPTGRGPAMPLPRGTTSGQVLACSVEGAEGAPGQRLRVAPGDLLVHVTRLWRAEGRPLSLEHLYLPHGLAPGPPTHPPRADELYAYLEEHRRAEQYEAVQSTEPVLVDETEAAVLEVALLSPALLIERLTTDETGRPVAYVRAVYRGDRYRVVSRLSASRPRLCDTAPPPSRAVVGDESGVRRGDSL
ncbi:GntR family transcriptional regulator [Streptomyces sp. NRRL F-5630]|uniref:GntR family transcriptional regulator n=1 Tax=Streptomyces sp. NRRL F-5630 TaxID=1463864 RepID=UPI000B2F2901